MSVLSCMHNGIYLPGEKIAEKCMSIFPDVKTSNLTGSTADFVAMLLL